MEQNWLVNKTFPHKGTYEGVVGAFHGHCAGDVEQLVGSFNPLWC